MQDDRRRVANLWVRANRVIAALTIPACLGMIVVAPDFVVVVLGERWVDATPVIQILAWVGILQSLQRLNGSVLQACDKAGTVLSFAVVAFVATILSFVIGLSWGIVGVAAAYAVATTLIQPAFTWLTVRAVGMPLLTYLRSFAGIVQASIAMFVAVLAARTLLVHEGASPAVRLIVSCLVGVAVFVPLCLWREPQLLAELRGLWQGRRRGGRLPKGPAEQVGIVSSS
jgi:O-antigen/teichoic acid export membrane protein